MKKYPKISIVTPSYNQGQFIEETILSILNQGYPNLEYIVIDGGSTDETVHILEKYNKQIAYWVSEKDDGQAHAINKGFAKATGDICAYINSDDLFLPGAFDKVVASYNEHHWKWCYSDVLVGENITTADLWKGKPFLREDFFVQQLVAQQGVFWVKDVVPLPYFRTQFQYIMDTDFFCRILLSNTAPVQIKATTAFFRIHPQAKTSNLERVRYSEGRKLFHEVFSQLDREGRNRLINARRRLVIRRLSARLDSNPFYYRSHLKIRFRICRLMLSKSSDLVTLRMSVSQLIRSFRMLMVR